MLTPSAPPRASAAALGPALSAMAAIGANPSVGEKPETRGATTTAARALLGGVDVQPQDAAADAAATAHDEDGHVVGSGSLESHGGLFADDALPGTGGGEKDDDSHREEAAEQEGRPRVKAAHRCAQPAHFTGSHDAARPSRRSFESWLSRVLSTQ